ncbi:MATE family efflux transporter [Amnibacterium setariae]|uniref:Uncharacterized protein n=1 Tax=Amnibacterium setariae TaxID=2306585 RepID=A0A3A1TTE1_9MICO|nr:polysaccharide biosynthesis C-terminal domain-containing protein [Amnibacterium setariae]RIX26623.1 hypothetical protein D1781_17065 [Amnibacterium setariae]
MNARRGGALRSGTVTFAGIAIGALATLALAQVVGRGLGPAGTGLFFQAVALFAIVSNGLQLGADTALVRTLSRHIALHEQDRLRSTVRSALLPVIGVSLLVSLAVFSCAAPIGAWITPSDPDYATELVRVMSPFLGAGALLTVVLGGTRGIGSTLPYTALQNLALPLSRLAVVAIGTIAGAGVQWIAAGWAAVLAPLVAIAALVLAGQLRSVSAPSSSTPSGSHSGTARLFWGFALPRGASTLIERALDWSGMLVVLAVGGPVVGGIYAIVNRCVNAGTMIDQAARIVVGPRISRALAVGDSDEAARLFLEVTRALVLVAWPFYLLLAVFAPAILSIFGPAFAAGALPLAIIALAMMLATTAGMVQSILLMGGRSSWQLGNRVVQLTVLLVVTALLVPRLGLLGAAIGQAASIAVDTVLAATQVAVKMRIRSSARLIALPAALAVVVIAGGGSVAAALFGRTLATFLIASIVLLVIYAITVLLLRGPLGLGALALRGGSSDPLPAPSPTPTPSPAVPDGAVALER